MDEQVSCVIRGLVQGVGFRWFAQREAAGMGLRGWVRNAPDGSVELTAQGPKKDLESLLVVLRKGPRSAIVRDITVEWSAPSGAYHSFEIR